MTVRGGSRTKWLRALPWAGGIAIVTAVSVIIVVAGARVPGERKFARLPGGGRGISLGARAERVIEQCRDAPKRDKCYDREIPALMDEISMEDAFEVTRIVIERDSSYAYCHLLAHNLSGRETRKDPEHWRDVLTRCPTGVCNYGCLHGPLLERFARDSFELAELERVKPELAEVCLPRSGWDPTPLERAMCYHGMGHLGMYITAADVGRAVELCRYLGEGSDDPRHVRFCLEGVFMQIFQPIEPTDEELVRAIAPTRETVRNFCSLYEGAVRSYCWREAWPFFREDIRTPGGMLEYCSYLVTPEGGETCRIAAINVVATDYMIDRDDIGGMRDYCAALPGAWAEECFVIAASRMLQTDSSYVDRAVAICRGAAEGAERCYDHLAGMVSKIFNPGDTGITEYCDALPGKWRDGCLSRPAMR